MKSTFEVGLDLDDLAALVADMDTAEGVDFRDCRWRASDILHYHSDRRAGRTRPIYLRLALAAALRAIYRAPGIPMTLIVEEGFVLGHHALIEQALSIARGFDGNMTISFQSAGAD